MATLIRILVNSATRHRLHITVFYTKCSEAITPKCDCVNTLDINMIGQITLEYKFQEQNNLSWLSRKYGIGVLQIG